MNPPWDRPALDTGNEHPEAPVEKATRIHPAELARRCSRVAKALVPHVGNFDCLKIRCEQHDVVRDLLLECVRVLESRSGTV